ncbi:MAG TPA: DinB family protein [Ktedonobacteraceae bacterium]
MTEQASPLATFYKPGWENYQQAIIKTIASLSSEQLALPMGPHYLSIGELLVHMLGARTVWFSAWMGEENAAMAHRGESSESGVPEAAELVAMFEETWRVISSALERWTSADLEQLILPPTSIQEWLRSRGAEEETAHTRQWIVWHVMEHEIHHGGELSLALGTHGVEGFYTW